MAMNPGVPSISPGSRAARRYHVGLPRPGLVALAAACRDQHAIPSMHAAAHHKVARRRNPRSSCRSTTPGPRIRRGTAGPASGARYLRDRHHRTGHLRLRSIRTPARGRVPRRPPGWRHLTIVSPGPCPRTADLLQRRFRTRSDPTSAASDQSNTRVSTTMSPYPRSPTLACGHLDQAARRPGEITFSLMWRLVDANPTVLREPGQLVQPALPLSRPHPAVHGGMTCAMAQNQQRHVLLGRADDQEDEQSHAIEATTA